MNSLDDVQSKMSALYEQVESGAVELKLADSLANIAGKYLKAEQLKFAREVFRSNRPLLPASGDEKQSVSILQQ